MKRFSIVIALLALLIVPFTAFAQDAPAVTVSDQVSIDGTVVVDSVMSDGPGFIVIHRDDNGSFGAVIGHQYVTDGENTDVRVAIDTSMATPTLYAMLHVDDNEMGVYEFGTVEGADAPVVVDGAPLSPPFNVDLLHVSDQLIDGSVTIDTVVAQVDGFVVIHADDNSSPGQVIGNAPISAGFNSGVTVEIDSENATDVVWPMLHVDTGEAGVYEFGEVEGADGPVSVNGTVAVLPIWTVPHIRAADQNVMHDDMAPTLVASSVLATEDGFLVVHADADGAPGPVIGFTPVTAGQNTDVMVELDSEGLTEVLWPMLHVDTGEAGVYEFGEVEGADGPVMVNGEVLVISVNTIADSMDDMSMDDMDEDMDDMDEDMDDMGDTEDMSDTCMVTPIDAAGVNLRASASTSSDVAGTLAASDSAAVVGQARGEGGFIWWNLARGSWVRSDIVSESGPCDTVGAVAMDDMSDMGDDMDSMDDMDEDMDDMSEEDMSEPAETEEAGA